MVYSGGGGNFQNEIVWRRTNRPKSTTYKYPSNHDLVLFYGGNRKINAEFADPTATQRSQYTKKDQWGRYKLAPAHAPEPRTGLSGESWKGISPPSGRHWAASVKNLPDHLTLPDNWDGLNVHERFDWLQEQKYLVVNGTSVQYKLYESVAKGPRVDDVWIDIPFVAGSEDVGYPTQKPLKLLDRIIKASSNPNDVILDPFCGCATTLVAAHNLERRWIGIDISPKAVDLVKMRLSYAQKPMFGNIIERTDAPHRDDLVLGLAPTPKTYRHTLYGIQEGICKGCLIHFPYHVMTIDHVVPRSNGGSDHFSNLQLLCSGCNSIKGTGSQAQLMTRLKERGLRQ